ncbi:uncharacterized protein C14orf93 homolog isoform X1 [Pleurodeles waltl]|uniref:uncharacterized protein C14orf93 homolog isoform X1 n=1 Tax=Pleurodeles waltl TaxID=8319 RepID=UPI0037093F2A
MSFSATILFSPPSGVGSEAKCCSCPFKSENSAPQSGSSSINCTPVSISGQGLAVQSTEQLLHLIYQRVEKTTGLAEAALGLAKSNNEILIRLQEEVGEMKQNIRPSKEALVTTPQPPVKLPSMQIPPAVQVSLSAQTASSVQATTTAQAAPMVQTVPMMHAAPERVCKSPDDESDSIGNVQVFIEELRQLGAAAAAQAEAVAGHSSFPTEKTSRDLRLANEGAPHMSPTLEEFIGIDGSFQRMPAPPFSRQLSPGTQAAIHRVATETGLGAEPALKAPPTQQQHYLQREDSLSPCGMVIDSSGEAGASCNERRSSCSPQPPPMLYLGPHFKARNSGQKNSRRKRDLVLSKLVHNVHNHISNNTRFNGSESIKSSWNMSVVKFLVEKLRQELVSSGHHYTDRELKGACVAYFLTKRREYRNSMNPFKSLKEKEDKKLRSRRYRLFANRSSIIHHFPLEEQQLWKQVTEELMSDEEDSLSEPGVWVARPPRFRSQVLTELCYHIDANSRHGTKANRIYGPPSERLPSAEVQVLPLSLYNPNFQEEEEEREEGSDPRLVQGNKTFCPELNSFIEVKLEQDE